MSNIITVPYQFTPRVYQRELLSAIDQGYKRAILVYHRRAGKDKTCFNIIVKKALQRVGVYYYLFPEFAQAKRVIWDGMDSGGFKFLDHIPEPLVQNKNGTDMKITLTNGSVIQLLGTDKWDKVRGANPIGCVFSEFAFQNPRAWNIIRPILAENKGWAIFNSSVNGKNHFYEMYQMAVRNKNWFVQNYTVEETLDENGNRYVSDEVVQEEREAGMSEEMIQAEFYNNWTSNSQGFYYLALLEDLEINHKVESVPYDTSVAVETWWDIGVGDYTCIWFTQIMGKEIHVIDYYSSNNRGLDHYAKVLQNKPYIYRSHNFPHDMANTEFGTGRTRLEVAEELFRGTRLNTIQKIGREDGINATRMIIPSCRFDKNKCSVGYDGLKNYRKEWDDKHQIFKSTPVHDWASDPADAFRTMAVGISMPKARSFKSEYMKTALSVRRKSWKTV